MQSPFLGVGATLINTEMPIHVSGLSLLAILICWEPSAALGALRTLGFKEKREQLRTESTRRSVC
jgi:hypothetical protein